MTHKPRRIIFIFFALLFISQLPLFPTHAQETISKTTIVPVKQPDLLIILSPQYGTDNDICNAIQAYMTVVENDLGWTSQILTIHENENDYQLIDQLIEDAYRTYPIKACIMVGEDLNTALAGDCDYLEQPSTLPWSTLGGTTAYETTDQGIICKPTTLQICISLLYPTHTRPYEQKKASIIYAFHKFTSQRHITNASAIQVFESSDLNTNSKALYQQLSQYGTLIYTQDATESDIISTLNKSYSAYFVHGHSSPAGTDLNKQQNSGWFKAETLDNLQTPFFGADGCYAAGWWSNQQDNNNLDRSIDAPWYGSKIFTSTTIQVMALGLLSQNGYSSPVSFVETVIPDLLKGTPLAEAMIGHSTIGDTIIVGDPTFHYTI
ncbi:MAG TPA: hypothetical protein VMY59_01285 [Candidatus Thermoplasmatota archaeon]|nr:hypothetical protein [Candidatus Thermoplasmatota archaeon]